MNATASLPSVAGKPMHRFRLRLPAILLWLLLLPIAPLLWLVLVIACVAGGVNPFRAPAVIFRVLAGLKGIHIEIQSQQVSILLSLF
jgi:hypothetical protein